MSIAYCVRYHLFTGAGRGPKVTIPCRDHADAVALADHLSRFEDRDAVACLVHRGYGGTVRLALDDVAELLGELRDAGFQAPLA